MGGTLPLGYDVHERKLVVNHEEAQTVKHIFERYLELGSVRELKQELDRRGIASAVKLSKRGHRHGGKPFSRGPLYCLLSNPIYCGEIRHKQQSHPGQHEAIVSRELWEQVQALSQGQARRQAGGRPTEAPPSPLAGKVFDERGEPLYVQGAANGKRRYRYYVSRNLVRNGPQDGEQGWRVSAPELEHAVAAAAQALLTDRGAIVHSCEESGIETNRLPSVLQSAQEWSDRLRSGSAASAVLARLFERVELGRGGMRLSFKLPLSSDEGQEATASAEIAFARFSPMQLRRRGIEMRLVLAGDTRPRRIDLPLLRAVARTRKWADDLVSGRVQSVDQLAQREALDGRSVLRLLPLGFLSPSIITLIVEGRQPPDLTIVGLTRWLELPLLWSAQAQALGIG
jgi:site-specific DNA recombinase